VPRDRKACCGSVSRFVVPCGTTGSSGGSSGGGRGAQPPYCRESHGAPLSPLYKFERKERRGWRRKKMKQPLLLVISVPPLIGRSNQNL